MDPSNYKSVVTSRGLTYHYFHSQPSNSSLPTLLFSHGFPSTSYDWHRILSALKPHGYGFIVPDQLGYGGTSKPDDPEAYRPSLISRDIADILDAEGIEHVIAIGHDWYAPS
jgi:soluble epoxide hydrolase / lipid-phosphate phosphatase